MNIEELLLNFQTAQKNYENAKSVHQTNLLAIKEAQKTASASALALESSSRELSQAKSLLARSVDIDAPVVMDKNSDVVNPVSTVQNNNIWYVVAIAAAIWAAIHFGIININSPFKPGPGPEPTPIPGPVNADPLRAVYIFDMSQATQSMQDIRNGVEKIESELKLLNCQYRAADISEDEVKNNYLNAVQQMSGRLPILIIQNDKTGKQVGEIIVAPATPDDVINAVKNARNSK